LGFGANKCVFAVGLVPNGRDENALGLQFLEGLELGLGLVCEAVTDAKRKSFESKHGGVELGLKTFETLGDGAPFWNGWT